VFVIRIRTYCPTIEVNAGVEVGVNVGSSSDVPFVLVKMVVHGASVALVATVDEEGATDIV
jgi:hypothetical protein